LPLKVSFIQYGQYYTKLVSITLWKLRFNTSSTVEAGFEATLLAKKLNFNVVAFHREEKNSVGFYTNPTTYASNYVNIEGRIRQKVLKRCFPTPFEGI
jgi:hypothetical protein